MKLIPKKAAYYLSRAHTRTHPGNMDPKRISQFFEMSFGDIETQVCYFVVLELFEDGDECVH